MKFKNIFRKKSSLEEIEGEIVKKTRRISPKKLFKIIIFVLVVAGLFAGFNYYRKYQELKRNPNAEAQKETEDLVSVVSKIMELPVGETPTVATIADKDKLKDQAFFAKAENGDKLLAYTKAMQAILYRPSTNKIISVAPIVINQPQAQANTITTPKPQAKVVAPAESTTQKVKR